jgi:hypothetical protein
MKRPRVRGAFGAQTLLGGAYLSACFVCGNCRSETAGKRYPNRWLGIPESWSFNPRRLETRVALPRAPSIVHPVTGDRMWITRLAISSFVLAP